MNESTETTITEQPRQRGDPIARCVNDLLSANAHGPGNLDMPALRRLLEFPKEDAAIVLRQSSTPSTPPWPGWSRMRSRTTSTARTAISRSRRRRPKSRSHGCASSN